MSAADPIPFIHSARLNRVAPDKGWLHLNLGAVQLRSIAVYRLPHSETFKLVCPGATIRREYLPHFVLSADFESVINCLLHVLWEKTEQGSNADGFRASADWFAKVRA